MPAKYQVRFARIAERDLEEIWAYIAADDPVAANRFVLKLESQIETLETYPARCALIPENELLGSSYRHLIFGEYRCIFKIDERTVHVMRVIHGARLLDMSHFGGPI